MRRIFKSLRQNIVTNKNSLGSVVGLVICTVTISTTSFGLISGEGQIGARNATWKQGSSSSKTSSTVLRLAGHLDPIPLVPVSFGLGLYSETWKVSEADHSMSSLSSWSAVPEIQAWIPLGDLRPFVRVGYSILSGYSGKANIGTAPANVSGSIALVGNGVHLAAGLEWNIPVVPLLSVIGSIEYADETVRLAKDKIGDVDISSAFKNVNLKSTAILLGAKLSI
ncbi:MAG: hypothetical protein NT027_20800 [Proteobacteria bacterium]|nr:hypothetical protein [Pseudomonadota bacterium]